MILHPAVCVHGLAQARLALQTAATLGRDVTLLSAPGAAGYAGCGWWRALIDAALAGEPGAACNDLLDCGDQAGRAMEALRHGQCCLILDPATPALAAVRNAALACRAEVLVERPWSLDLAVRGAERHLAEWLAGRPAG